jgi:hypothetical protein
MEPEGSLPCSQEPAGLQDVDVYLLGCDAV